MKENKSEKIVIIGIDGGTWEILGPACDKKLMPNLDKFKQKNCWGGLKSTHPPITPVAWTSLMTGQSPGKHGVLGFQEYDPKTNKLKLTNSITIKTETLWQKLARHGKHVVVVAVPMTYPAQPVNGVLVTGFETPSIENDFTYPKSFKNEILKKIPDYTFKRRTRRKDLMRPDDVKAYIEDLKLRTRQNIDVFKMGLAKTDWDVSMLVLRSFDEMLHKFWKLLDFRIDTSDDPRDKLMAQYFLDLDKALEELFEIAEENNAVTILVSDHGGSAKLGNIYPNRLLKKLGYLKTAPWWKLFLKHIEKQWFRPTSKGTGWKVKYITEKICFEKTLACVLTTNSYGGLNLRTGLKADTVTEIIQTITNTLTKDGRPLFEFIKTPTELYGCVDNKDRFPEFLLAPHNGYTIKTDISGSEIITHSPQTSITGDHSLTGMFGVMGNGICLNKHVEAEIIDIAPTVLAMLNLPITNDMDGRVIEEIFQKPIKKIYEPAQRKDEYEEYEYKKDEEDEIVSRLSDLGYL